MVTNSNTTTKVSTKQSLIQLLGSMLTSIKLVFSNWAYIALAGTIAAIFWIVFNLFERAIVVTPPATLFSLVL